MQLKNQVIVISGGGSGMGAETAMHLAKSGAKIALIDINFAAAEKYAKKIDGFAVTCDIRQEKEAADAIQQIVTHFGKINGCVNCAGVVAAERIVGKEGPQRLMNFARVIEINLLGTFNIMRLCGAQMLKQEPVNSDGERGVIINTASVAAYEGQIGQAAYSASKGGVVSMTLPAAREFARFGVRVMTIAPGIIDTPMMAGMPENIRESLTQSVAFPKRLGRASEYAELVKTIFENGYLNGSVIRLDGAIRMSDC